jgi:hypothetical protein
LVLRSVSGWVFMGQHYLKKLSVSVRFVRLQSHLVRVRVGVSTWRRHRRRRRRR